jgi:hypothetical protein
MKLRMTLGLLCLLATSQIFAAEQSQPERIDVTRGCNQQSSIVGKSFALTTRAHGVSGQVMIVDDCTLSIKSFNYDGKGLQVEIYSARGGDFAQGQALSKDLLRPSAPYQNAELLLRLPAGQTVDSIEGLSIWCSEVGVSFGDVLFSK